MTMAAGNLWLALTVTVLTTTTVHGQSWKKERCDQLGLDYLSEISQPTCFSSAKLGEGPVSAEVAQNLCLEYEFGELPSLESKTDLSIVLNWAIGKGLPNDTEAGFWTAWKREIAAPLSLNGTLSPKNEEIRKDRKFFGMYGGNIMMPDGMWRNESQPGNTLDERDEQCTAQSRPGIQPEYLGIDDYECNGTQLHFVICQISTETFG
ncbi:uncharacterized protein LOC142338256 [Convolutriloba macropyga]|uniref:uncharacterized protein LOC142338256 n=1 Tax=Convolutriloba macropyga TaxID=536237 RepID=UPI003F525486